MAETYTIQIQPHERKIETKKGRRLLEALADHSIFIQSSFALIVVERAAVANVVCRQ